MDIFISHSSKDKVYGSAMVQLLIDIGVPRKNITFTSKKGFGIPQGHNIFEWLKNKLTSSPFVIYLLSDNYYGSVACLNEMGAAWVIENRHQAFILPGFDIDDEKFRDGAIDPREIVAFINRRDDLLEFIDQISYELRIKPSLVEVMDAVSVFQEAIANDNDSVLSEEDVDGFIDNNDSILYEEVKKNIINNTLSKEEILLLRFMSDEGEFILGDRWMAKGQIEKIQVWEDELNIDPILSKAYAKALHKLITREYFSVYSKTQYGNPRQYELDKDISRHIVTLEDELTEVTNRIIESYKKSETNPWQVQPWGF